MKVRLLYLALIAIIPFLVGCASTKTDKSSPLGPEGESSAIYLGPCGGYNRSIHTVDLASFAKDPLCPFFTNGNDNGYYFGAFYEQKFGPLSQHSAILRVTYDALPTKLSQIGDNFPSLVDLGGGQFTTVRSFTEHSIAVTYNLISIDLMYKFRAFGGFVLTAGPTFDLVMQKRLLQKYQITAPSNIQFKRDPTLPSSAYQDNDRTIIVYDSDNPYSNSAQKFDAASTRFGLKFGVQYEIETGTQFSIIPGIFYNLGLSNLETSQSWKVNAIQAGFDIRYALGL